MDKRRLSKTKEHKEKLRLAQPHRIEPPKKEVLEKLYIAEKKSTRRIAEVIGTNQRRVMAWLELYKIPRRSYKENKMPVKKGSNHTWGKKIGKSMTGNTNTLTKEKHWNWKGGITPLGRQIRNSVKYKRWRTKVFKRDNWTCKNCKARSKKGQRVCIEADHYPEPFSKICKKNKIKTFEDAMSCRELWQLKKGRTLCKKCHNDIGWQLFKEANPRKKYA